MSQFVNSLLTTLLGWMRALFSSVLSLTRADGGGFLAWMSRRWLALTVLLILAGLAIDLAVYILRWRPQYVWRSKLYRLTHRRQEAAADARFNAGYDSALTDFNFAASPIAPLAEPIESPEEILAPYYGSPSASQEEIDLRMLPGAGSVPLARRRRSARHKRRAARIRFRLPDLSEADRSPLYPEPPVNARDAFHQPVYPAIDVMQKQEDAFDDE